MRKKVLKKQVIRLIKQNNFLKQENLRLRELHNLKDAHFTELMSDGLRNGSKLAARHMAERRCYLNGK